VSAVATRDPQRLVTDPPAAVRSAPRLFQPGEVALEDVVLGVWEDLARDGRAGCPVCGGRMESGAGCEGCGSELS
jgi:tRNA(Ile2) C34 agmatinyltransferase TiaS